MNRGPGVFWTTLWPLIVLHLGYFVGSFSGLYGWFPS